MSKTSALLFSSAFNPDASAPSMPAASSSSVLATSASASNASRKRKRKSLEAGLSSSSAGVGSSVAAASPYDKRKLVKEGQANLEKAMKIMKQIEKNSDSTPNQKGPKAIPSKAANQSSIHSQTKKKQKSNDSAATSIPSSSKTINGQKGDKRSSTFLNTLPDPSPKKSKAIKKAEKTNETESVDHDSPEKPITVESTSALMSISQAATGPMTTLQSKLSSKLSSAKFRWLNEQLYNVDSQEGWQLMRNEGGKAFDEYHKSHRQQTAHWPSPPLPYIMTAIRLALPSDSLIVDLGCGDAELAQLLSKPADKQMKKDLGPKDREKTFRVISYDLVGDVEFINDPSTSERKGWVAPVDYLSAIPLPGHPGGIPAPNDKPSSSKPSSSSSGGPEIVDAAVCCLSLMGVNWIGGIYEAARVLKQGGTLHVAEVTSRIISHDAFKRAITSFGFELVKFSAPTTHFDLFEFRKSSKHPLGPVRNQKGWDQRIAAGREILKGCVYKKR